MIAVKYIGHRKTYREGCYGSGLIFTQGETINVDDALAQKLLRHPDVYAPGSTDEAVKTAPSVSEVAKPDDEEQKQDMRDSIANMTKTALESFAKTHFSVDLDKRKSVGDLRTQVTGLFDQFGLE